MCVFISFSFPIFLHWFRSYIAFPRWTPDRNEQIACSRICYLSGWRAAPWSQKERLAHRRPHILKFSWSRMSSLPFKGFEGWWWKGQQGYWLQAPVPSGNIPWLHHHFPELAELPRGHSKPHGLLSSPGQRPEGSSRPSCTGQADEELEPRGRKRK